MAEITVAQSAANAAEGSAVYELARIVNQLQAVVAELKADYNAHKHGASADGPTLLVAAADADTIKFRATGVPT